MNTSDFMVEKEPARAIQNLRCSSQERSYRVALASYGIFAFNAVNVYMFHLVLSSSMYYHTLVLVSYAGISTFVKSIPLLDQQIATKGGCYG